MNYYSLAFVKILNGESDAHEELIRRKSASTSFTNNLKIDAGKLFVNILPQMHLISNDLYIQSRAIMRYIEQLDKDEQVKLRRKIAILETIDSNKLEGVNLSVRQAQKSALLNGYLHPEPKVWQQFSKAEDLAKVYQKFILPNLAPDKKPDGKLFRNGPVYLVDGKKVIHAPKDNEEDVTKQINEWFKFRNNVSELYLDQLITACVSHFYLEYVHPYYDGNGRLGRLILSCDLNNILDPYSSLMLSQAIYDSPYEYYHEFSELEKPDNHGEVTLFVKMLFDYISDGQVKLLEMLNEGE